MSEMIIAIMTAICVAITYCAILVGHGIEGMNDSDAGWM